MKPEVEGTAAITATEATAPIDLNKAMDDAFSPDEPTTPEPSADKEENVEPETVTDAENTESPEADPEPKPAEPKKEPAVIHTLTPEEEHLLRRNGTGADDLAFYQSLTVEQRNRALAPLRRAQADKDKFWSLPKEERARLAQESNLSEGAPAAPDPTETSLRESFRVAPEKLKKIAEKEGISVESLTELTDAMAAQIAGRVSPIVRELDSVRQRDSRSESVRVIGSTRDELVKSFPQIKDDKVWSEICNDEETVALAEAKVTRNGGDRARAIRESLNDRVRLRFYDHIQTQSRQRSAEGRKNALRGTSEPTGSGRGSLNKRPQPQSLDEAMDQVFAGSDE